MGTKPGILGCSPWQKLGSYKYLIYVPFILNWVQVSLLADDELQDNVWFHLLQASALRYLHMQLWMSVTRCHFFVQKRKIQNETVTFEQKDREVHWDDRIILQLLAAACMMAYVPALDYRQLPLWNGIGMICVLMLHAGPIEFLYYWGHRTLHESPNLFKSDHALHHLTSVPEPTSGFMLTFAEHLAFSALVSIPFLGAGILGVASISMFYCYWLFLDFIAAVGHCNWEFVPSWIFNVFPFLKYLILTPTYHSQHHSVLGINTNYALSIPLYDYLAGTFNTSTYYLHASVRKGRNDDANKPDYVFLVHESGMDSILHTPMSLIGFHTTPFRHRWFVTLLMPITVPIILLMWAFGTPFWGYQYRLEGLMGQVWVMPRFGFQYFLGYGRDNINKLIENAIVEADCMGVKVLALGALNKMEELNEGGRLFIKLHPNLRMRVCHGNTLTAGVILNGLPLNVEEVFLTGSTSKLGRAVSIYLAHHGVRVLMLTLSASRFESIRIDCPDAYKHNLVHVTNYQDAQHCMTWVLGKRASASDQKWAPRGTKFHQFVVPTVQEVRKDCTYGALAAMHLPKHVKGLDTCEIWLPRGVVHACHAGGLLHALEGWTHHELGPVPVDRIDMVWRTAKKHGFLPVESQGLGYLDYSTLKGT